MYESRVGKLKMGKTGDKKWNHFCVVPHAQVSTKWSYLRIIPSGRECWSKRNLMSLGDLKQRKGLQLFNWKKYFSEGQLHTPRHWPIFTTSIVSCFPAFHINGILQYVAISDELLPLINMQIRIIRVFGLMVHSFLFLSIIQSYGRTMGYLSTHRLRISWLLSVLGNE